MKMIKLENKLYDLKNEINDLLHKINVNVNRHKKAINNELIINLLNQSNLLYEKIAELSLYFKQIVVLDCYKK